jgi:two-component system OmpR family sensor kinase
MTLTARLTSFFLGVLACVLVGFSVGLYCLASNYLHDQAAERLDSALHTLAAAADVGPEGVEWEPGSRSLSLGQDASEGEIRWLVRDPRGQEVDRSKNLSDDEAREFLQTVAGTGQSIATDWSVEFLDGETWRLRRLRITAGAEHVAKESGPAPLAVPPARASSPPPAASESNAEPGGALHPELSLTAGVSLAPIKATLRNLALALGGLSIGLWSVAAISGRGLCRRALVPVTRMAEAARRMKADDWHTRLPSPGTRDELQDLAGAFNGLLKRLEESFERQRRFTGDASHQLRTPVAGMLGQVEVALLRERSPEEYRRVLEAVRSQAIRLRQIVETQLFLARADAESLEPQLETLDLAEWLPAYLESWQEHPRQSDLRFQSTNGKKAEIQSHPQLLAQLLDNLLDNAAKYSLPGKPITISLRSDDSEVECSVEDAGCGIAPADLPHIFEPFYRSSQARQSGIAGAGLGLAVAQRISTALGGALRAENIASGGARFILLLPRLGHRIQTGANRENGEKTAERKQSPSVAYGSSR